MKKTSILLASTVMVLAVIVAIVGVTAAWFGNQYFYNGAVEVSSANPSNGAIIVQGSASDLPTGEDAVLAPARIKPGLILNDVDGTGGYDQLDVLDENLDSLETIATKVTVTFDFVYNGAAPNTDGTTTMSVSLVSVTLMNPHYYVNSNDQEVDVSDLSPEEIALLTQKTREGLTNYRDEFKVDMYVITTDSTVEMFNTDNKYAVREGTDDKGNPYTYYVLADKQYDNNNKTDYSITFKMIPVTHTLNAVLYFVHVDELTPPELMDAQLFLNFKVEFIAN
ncbi:MAG: hypothetical protein IKC54_03655 [Clostridia bacterium]|nr:hypothetical protein [Clostridia bacterium]